MLPNLAGVAIAYLLLTVPQVVMIESFLSFLGLGVQEHLGDGGELGWRLLYRRTGRTSVDYWRHGS